MYVRECMYEKKRNRERASVCACVCVLVDAKAEPTKLSEQVFLVSHIISYVIDILEVQLCQMFPVVIQGGLHKMLMHIFCELEILYSRNISEISRSDSITI